jgi:hypothetical protein
MYTPKWGSNFCFIFPTSEGSDLLSSHVMQTPTFISKLSDGNVIFRLDVGKKYFLARRKRPKLEIVRCWLIRQWRYSGGRSTYYYFGALKNNFSQLFRRFGILNCNLSDSLKNLPTLFQKWFGYFYRNKS